MPDESEVCPQCGVPMEARDGWVPAMCPACAGKPDTPTPELEELSLWWLLAALLVPGMINLVLAAAEMEGLADLVGLLGGPVCGVVAVRSLTPKLPGPRMARVGGGMILGILFALATFMVACYGCMIPRQNGF